MANVVDDGATRRWRQAAARRTPTEPLRVWLGAVPGELRAGLRAALAERFSPAGAGWQPTPNGARKIDAGREAVTLDVYTRGGPVAVTSAYRGRRTGRRTQVGAEVAVTRFDVTRSGPLTVTRGANKVIGWAARGRYRGIELDEGTAPAEVLRHRGYALALLGEGQQAPPAGSCLVIALTGSAKTAGCAGLDVIGSSGGEVQWRRRGLLSADGKLTDDGERVALRLVLAALLKAPPRGERAAALSRE